MEEIRKQIIKDLQELDEKSLVKISNYIQKLKERMNSGDENFYKNFDMTGYGDYYQPNDNSNSDEFDDDFFNNINEICNDSDYDYDSDGYYFTGFRKLYEEYDD